MNCVVCNKNIWIDYTKKLLKCRSCGFIRARDKYFKVKEKNFYGPRYFREIDYDDYFLEKKALKKNFEDRLKRIRKYKKSGKLLEIGCAYGYFLCLAQKYFKTTGIDLNPKVTKIAQKNSKNSRVITGDFLKRKFPDNFFDIVIMLDTIEHLKTPSGYLTKIKSGLRA